MKCLQKLFLSPLRLVVFSLLLSITFSTVLIKNNTYAVSDYVFTLDSSNTGYNIICDNTNSSPVNCSDYNYLIVDTNFVFSTLPSGTWDVYFNIGYSTSQRTYQNPFIPVPITSVIYDLSSFHSYNFIRIALYNVNGQNLLPSDWSFTFTLTDSISSSGIVPSGSLSITENGTFDVTNYAQAVVDVPAVPGDYHDDLQDVKKAIILVPAVCLVIYFFYAIYKMIMGGVRR